MFRRDHYAYQYFVLILNLFFRFSASYAENYVSGVCSDGNGNNKAQRYAKVKGYGYATNRCICYTDGTGCDCDEQNELKALQNVATYGPATVCLEASTWQDYAGGILTSNSGCSPAFLDMNHCVQAVGYAFTDTNEANDDAANNDNSRSGSGSKKSGSQDDGNREGYWIIRNQWSQNWGYVSFACQQRKLQSFVDSFLTLFRLSFV